jgi:hypothetical protein
MKIIPILVIYVQGSESTADNGYWSLTVYSNLKGFFQTWRGRGEGSQFFFTAVPCMKPETLNSVLALDTPYKRK